MAFCYLDMNYYRKISVAGMAGGMGLDRSYFSSIFRAGPGVSPRTYLIRYRLEKACELMKDDALSLSEIAWSVGYPDRLQFSRAFRRVMGLPPKRWRAGERAR